MAKLKLNYLKAAEKKRDEISELYRDVSVEPRRRKAERKPRKKKGERLALFRRPIVCPPDSAEISKKEEYLGVLFRFAVLLLTVFAFTFFITDTFRFGFAIEVKDKWGNVSIEDFMSITDTVFTASFIVTIFLFLAATFRLVRSLLPLGCLAAVGVSTLMVPDTLKRLLAITLTAWDEILARLHRVDYFTLIPRPEIDMVGMTEEELVLASVFVVAIVIGLIFIPALTAKVRIAVPLVFCIALFSFVFSCNITRSNWPFTLVICSLVAIIVLWRYDALYRRPPSTELFDTTAELFLDPNRPSLSPEASAYLTATRGRKSEKKRRREEKREERRRKRALRRGQTTVDVELTDYFAPSVKKEKAVRLTPKEKKQQRKAAKAARLAARKNRAKVQAELHALQKYDRRVVERRAASAGFAGFAAFALAFIVLFFPTLTVDRNFKTIEAIDEAMQNYREYLTALLVGDEDLLDAMDYERDPANHTPRSASLQNRYYSGKSLFYVRARSYDSIYMRGWVAVDYVNGAWTSADKETLEDYETHFDLDEFPAETLRSDFYAYFLADTYLNSSYGDVNFLERARYENEFGAVMQQISIRRLDEELGSLLYLPTTFVERMGLKNYESADESKLNFVNYFDGIYTGRDFKELAEYSAVIYSGPMNNSSYQSNIAERIQLFLDNYELYTLYKSGYFTDEKVNAEVTVEKIEGSSDVYTTATYAPYALTIRSRCTRRGEVLYSEIVNGNISASNNLFYAYLHTMTRVEQNALERYFSRYTTYRDFVYRTYLSTDITSEGSGEDEKKSGSKIISDLADELYLEMLREEKKTADPADYNNENYLRHSYIKYVLKYFYNHFTFLEYDKETYDIIIDPEILSSSTGLDPIEAFLMTSKQGYCVQFASALTLLLREKGIPARYVEGYVASDLTRDDTVRGSFVYQQIVRDYNAHAWVEVWFDGIGWVTYEATTGSYYRDFYPAEDLPPLEDEDEDPSRPSTPEKDPEEENEEETPPEVDLEEMTPEEREEYEKQLRRAEFLRKLKIFLLWFAAILAVSGAVATVVLLAARAEKRRDRRIKRIKAGQFSDDERRTEALWLIDESAALLKLYGLAPRMGEQRDEYAARLLSEMPSVFGQAPQIEGDDKVAPSAFTYPMDPEKIYRDIAAEEFGNGMTKREMCELAEYYSRLRTQKVRFISFPRRWVLHFVLHRI